MDARREWHIFGQIIVYILFQRPKSCKSLLDPHQLFALNYGNSYGQRPYLPNFAYMDMENS